MSNQTRGKKPGRIRKILFIALLVPLLLYVLLVVVVFVPFYLTYRLILRFVVELRWAVRGRRILLVYSRSPVWQAYIETNWLPLLRDHAMVLNWSDRAAWRHTQPFAARVFRHWAPDVNFNPMAILLGRFPRTRHIGFYYAFRDWKHGNEGALRAAESQLFGFVEGLSRTNA